MKFLFASLFAGQALIYVLISIHTKINKVREALGRRENNAMWPLHLPDSLCAMHLIKKIQPYYLLGVIALT